MQRPLLPDVEVFLPLELAGNQDNNQATRPPSPVSNRFHIRYVLIGVVIGFVIAGSAIYLEMLLRGDSSPQMLSFFTSMIFFLFWSVMVCLSLLTRRGYLYFHKKFDHAGEASSMNSCQKDILLLFVFPGVNLGSLFVEIIQNGPVKEPKFLALAILNVVMFYLALRWLRAWSLSNEEPEDEDSEEDQDRARTIGTARL
jgi:cytochrome bd-type quinol oxidase subunit 2